MYLAGFNEFGQLESNNKERATCGSHACTHHLTLEDNLVSMNICFTWTNLFSLDGNIFFALSFWNGSVSKLDPILGLS